jgi:hypothetical protein
MPASSESEETEMGLVLALTLIVVLLGGFYVNALWWAAPAVAALLLAGLVARFTARRKGARPPRQRDGANVDGGRARRSRLNV